MMLGLETIFASPTEFIIACAVLAAAEAIYVMLGFGAGLVAVGCLALVMPDLRDVVVLLLLIGLPAELWVVKSSWRRISWRGVLLIAVGIAVGVPAGTALLRFGEPQILLTLLGVMLVAVGSLFLYLGSSARVHLPAWFAPPIGLISGILSGLFGTGGPPLVLYYQLRGIDKAAFRGNLMAVFLLISLIRVPSYVVGGLVTAPRLWSALLIMPAVAAGAWIGNRVHLNLREETFRRSVSAALVAIGVLLLL